MTYMRFRKLIDELGMSQVCAADFLSVDPRTLRRWASGEKKVPIPVAMLLEIMLDLNVTREQAEKYGGLK